TYIFNLNIEGNIRINLLHELIKLALRQQSGAVIVIEDGILRDSGRVHYMEVWNVGPTRKSRTRRRNRARGESRGRNALRNRHIWVAKRWGVALTTIGFLLDLTLLHWVHSANW